MEMSTMMSQAQPPAATAAGIPATPQGADGETQQVAERSAFAALLNRHGTAAETGQKADSAAEPVGKEVAAAKEEAPTTALDTQAMSLLAMLQLVQLPVATSAVPAPDRQEGGEQAAGAESSAVTVVGAMAGGSDRQAESLAKPERQQQAVIPQADLVKATSLPESSASSKEAAAGSINYVPEQQAAASNPAPQPLILPAGQPAEGALPAPAEAAAAVPAGADGKKVLQSGKQAMLSTKPVNGAGQPVLESVAPGERLEGGKDGGDKASVKVEVRFSDSSAGQDSAGEGGGNQLPQRDAGGNTPIHAGGMQLPATPEVQAQTGAQPATPMDKAALHDSVMALLKEALVTHDSKGNGQVTIRLNPAELGELRINVRLEDQQLKVEVVSENRQVREALMGNLDSLKETLLKQHLNMERFTVATGNGSSFQGFQQTHQERHLPGQNAYRPFAMGAEEEDAADTAGRYAYEQRDNALVDLRL